MGWFSHLFHKISHAFHPHCSESKPSCADGTPGPDIPRAGSSEIQTQVQRGGRCVYVPDSTVTYTKRTWAALSGAMWAAHCGSGWDECGTQCQCHGVWGCSRRHKWCKRTDQEWRPDLKPELQMDNCEGPNSGRTSWIMRKDGQIQLSGYDFCWTAEGTSVKLSRCTNAENQHFYPEKDMSVKDAWGRCVVFGEGAGGSHNYPPGFQGLVDKIKGETATAGMFSPVGLGGCNGSVEQKADLIRLENTGSNTHSGQIQGAISVSGKFEGIPNNITSAFGPVGNNVYLMKDKSVWTFDIKTSKTTVYDQPVAQTFTGVPASVTKCFGPYVHQNKSLLYFFDSDGSTVWIHDTNKSTVPPSSTTMEKDFPYVPPNPDAVCGPHTKSGETFVWFFKGSTCYVFSLTKKEILHADKIDKVFPGLPTGPDAAFGPVNGNELYVYKGFFYWVFDLAKKEVTTSHAEINGITPAMYKKLASGIDHPAGGVNNLMVYNTNNPSDWNCGKFGWSHVTDVSGRFKIERSGGALTTQLVTATNLNKGSAGFWVYMAYSNFGSATPIEDVVITKGSTPSGYQRVASGLNPGISGTSLFVCFKRGNDRPIQDIRTVTSEHPNPTPPKGWTLVKGEDGANGDLNQGAGGEYVYLVVQKKAAEKIPPPTKTPPTHTKK
jgi:hypothetical protein